MLWSSFFTWWLIGKLERLVAHQIVQASYFRTPYRRDSPYNVTFFSLNSRSKAQITTSCLFPCCAFLQTFLQVRIMGASCLCTFMCVCLCLSANDLNQWAVMLELWNMLGVMCSITQYSLRFLCRLLSLKALEEGKSLNACRLLVHTDWFTSQTNLL